jgi:hypothetical protein
VTPVSRPDGRPGAVRRPEPAAQMIATKHDDPLFDQSFSLVPNSLSEGIELGRTRTTGRLPPMAHRSSLLKCIGAPVR